MDTVIAILTYPLVWALLKTLAVILPVVLGVAYMTFAERKVLAYMHLRIGPNRVGYYGLLQPFADLIKMVFKEWLIPASGNKFLFVVAPIVIVITAFGAWAVIPFGDGLVGANVDAGILYILAMTSLGTYGVIIAGWASNSKYALLSALRSGAQVISYELAMGFALITVMMSAGSLNLSEIVKAQAGLGFISWYWIPLLPMAVVYFVAGVAETNRAPFDVVEGESEIVAGFHIEYSGTGFACFFLAEYANMILVSALASIMFLGGWLSPFAGIPYLSNIPILATDGIGWMLVKMAFFLFAYIWFRATFPRYRYDHLMRLGWKIFIPLTILWVFVVIIFHLTGFGPWYS
ncbi:NADH-quinone oxidoreductase subunit H [Gammaproteobacteria bacterium]|nr:NADH-quinone oxidoreductase subunit H [Gammaproteobacteria bacterium]